MRIPATRGRLTRLTEPLTRPHAGLWRKLAHLALILLLILLPLPWRRSLAEQTYPGVNAELTSLSIYLSDIAILALFALVLPGVKTRQRPPSYLRAFIYPLALLVLLAAASALWAFDLVLALQQALRLVILLALVLVLIRLRPNRRAVQVGLAATIVVQAVTALWQFSRQDDLGLRWLGEIDLNRYPGGGSIITVGDQYWLRGYGLTPHPNILGGILALALLTLVTAYLRARPRHRPLLLVVLLAGAAGLFISFSRSAWLGSIVGGGFLVAGLLLQRPWRRAYGRGLMVLMVASSLLVGSLAWQQQHLLLARSDPNSSLREARSINERGTLNAAALAFVRLAPLTGVGAGNSAVATVALVADTPGVTPQPAHLAPLLLTAELGILGGALWLWLTWVPAVIALIRLRQGRLSLWALGLTAALVAFGVIDLFDYYAWGWAQGRLLRWLYWGLWGAAVSVNSEQ